MSSLRQQQKLATKQKLLKTAFDEFSTHGLLATKTLDIAKSAQVSHGLVFAHFPTKEALVLAVIDEFGMQLGHKLEHEIKRGTLEAVLTCHVKVLAEWEPFYRQLVLCGPHLPENIRAAIFTIQSGVAYYLEQALMITPKMPLHMVINCWLGLLHYYLANKDLFCPNGSLLATKGPELIQFYTHLVDGTTYEKM